MKNKVISLLTIVLLAGSLFSSVSWAQQHQVMGPGMGGVNHLFLETKPLLPEDLIDFGKGGKIGFNKQFYKGSEPNKDLYLDNWLSDIGEQPNKERQKYAGGTPAQLPYINVLPLETGEYDVMLKYFDNRGSEAQLPLYLHESELDQFSPAWKRAMFQNLLQPENAWTAIEYRNQD